MVKAACLAQNIWLLLAPETYFSVILEKACQAPSPFRKLMKMSDEYFQVKSRASALSLQFLKCF